MAISQFLIGLPLLILMVSIGIQGGNFQGGNATHVICNPNSTANCVSSGSNTTFTCPADAPGGSCNIGTCTNGLVNPGGGSPTPPPPPSFCTDGPPGPGGTSPWQLPAGTSVTVPSSVAAANQSSSSGFFFGFGSIGTSGFIAMIGLVVGVVALAGLTIFGSGTSAESIHILFMGGLMLGIWIFFSGLEGFLGNVKTSIFSELNGPLTSPGGMGFGTEFYILLTLMYLFGFMGMVKRGGV